MTRTRTEHCRLCGAPLPEVAAVVVTCAYCGAENRLVAKEVEAAQAAHVRMTAAAEEARALAAEVDERAKAVQAQYEAALIANAEGPTEAGFQQVSRLFETLFRPPSGPEPPRRPGHGRRRVPMLTQLEEAITRAVADADAAYRARLAATDDSRTGAPAGHARARSG